MVEVSIALIAFGLGFIIGFRLHSFLQNNGVL